MLGLAYAALSEMDRAIEFFQSALLLGDNHFYSLKQLEVLGVDHLWESPGYQKFLQECKKSSASSERNIEKFIQMRLLIDIFVKRFCLLDEFSRRRLDK